MPFDPASSRKPRLPFRHAEAPSPGHSPSATADHAAPPPPLRRRQSLTVPSLAIHVSGQPAAAERLREALAVPPMPQQLSPEERPLVEAALCTHLFHSFAARTHPLLVRRLLADVQPGQAVLDPFAGSGTVLLEGLLRGARTFGCDISELAIRLARFKTTPWPLRMLTALRDRCTQVTEASLARVQAKQRPRRTWDDARFYAPHIYLELCGLREEIEAVRTSDAPLGEAMLLILSSLLIKLSTQAAESSEEQVDRQIGRGMPSRWFQNKANEVYRLHAALQQKGVVSPLGPRPQLHQGDARVCLTPGAESALVLPAASIDVVVTSPPYLGTYDYAHHHARRYAWLGIDPTPIEQGEMAARRHGQTLPLHALLEQHQRDSLAWISAIARLLRPGGSFFVLVGDSIVADQFLDGAEPIVDAATQVGLPLVARAAAERPHFYKPPAPGDLEEPSDRFPPRQEHLLHFQRP